MSKSVINVLQEHCILKYKKYPDYSTRDTSFGGSPQFLVECRIAGINASGSASSKGAAKTQAAEQMILKLGLGPNPTTNNSLPPIKLPAATINPGTNDNFVGALNEYCSKNNFPYPQYIEGYDGTFVTQCKHKEMMTSGKGTNKKIAKQESAKAMYQLCTNKNAFKKTGFESPDYNFYDSDTLSFKSSFSPDVIAPVTSPNKECKFVPPGELDSVSAMNVYCDKYNYKKPEYFDCGKVGNKYTTKCVYQYFATHGTGVTTKFAKQDSARLMLEIIGARPKSKEEDLIDMNDSSTITLSPSVANPLDNKTIIDFYKNSKKLDKVKTNNDLDNLMSFFDLPSTPSSEDGLHTDLQKVLTDNKVKYDIYVSQKGDPWIINLSGKRLMNDGQIIEKTLVEMGERHSDVVRALLMKAIKSFNCE